MKKHLGLGFIFIVTIISISSLALGSTEPITTAESNSNTLYIYIKDVYYCCLEDDLIENDIFTSITISFLSPYYYNHLYMYLDLELPSGAYYAYIVSLEFYGLYDVVLPIFLLNHATESGDYILFVALWFSGPHDNRLAISESIFDPPGSHGDSGDAPTEIIIG